MPILFGLSVVLVLLLVFGPQLWIQHAMRKHGGERPDLPGTGGELARHLLDEAGLADVPVEATDIGDHYDPEERVVRLLPQHLDGGRSRPSPSPRTRRATPCSMPGRSPASCGAWR